MNQQTTPSCRPWRTALAWLCLLSCASAWAQWQWLDDTGRRVFSDTPPPLSVPDKNILRRPPGQAQPTPNPSAVPAIPALAAPAAVPASTAAAAPTAAPAGRDSALEARKKQAEEAAQAKEKAEADRIAKARAESCERAKRAKATLETGMRLATVNAQGEREVMDDKARAAESKRIDDIIRSDCGKKPASSAAQ